MRRRPTRSIAGGLLSLLAPAIAFPAQPTVSPKDLKFEWSVAAIPEESRSVRGKLSIRDLATEEVIAERQVRSTWGDCAEVMECTRKWCLEASVKVSPSGAEA